MSVTKGAEQLRCTGHDIVRINMNEKREARKKRQMDQVCLHHSAARLSPPPFHDSYAAVVSPGDPLGNSGGTQSKVNCSGGTSST